jgi:hypothetical protein
MALDEAKLRRLSFIRYMYMLGVDQSRQPKPYSAVSILTFHDAVELFFQLAAEHLDAPVKTNTEFMAYWPPLNLKLGGDKLTHKPSMNRLNTARRGLKHAGTRPSEDDVAEFPTLVTQFFRENTPTVFGIEFENATLINFVKPESARQHLEQARASQGEGDLIYALTYAGIAFYEVVEGPLEQMGAVSLGRYSFLRSRMSKLRRHLNRESSRALEDIADIIEDLWKEVESVSSTMAVLGLDLDPHRFARFRSVTPTIYQMASGEYSAMQLGTNMDQATKDDVEFCISFVIETAVTLADLQSPPS